jgi:hypothetical protein
MAYFYATRTVALPVTADGNCVKDAHGAIIARCEGSNPFLAGALCDLVNAGAPILRAHEQAHDAAYDASVRAMLNRAREA